MAERFCFERELANLGLRDAHDGVREYLNGAPVRDVAVGEQIVLDVKDTEYAAYDIVSVRWTIPGTRVASYEATRKKAKVTELASSDLDKLRVTFHWVNAGKREVSATITYRAGGVQKTATVVAGVFNVSAPRLDRFGSTTKRPGLIKRGSLRGIRFGTLTKGKRGIEWNWKMTMPAKHAGWVKDLQTIRENRVRVLKDGRTCGRRNPAKAMKDVHEQLDQSLWDAGTEPTYSSKGYYDPIAFPTEVAKGKSFANARTWDSPHTSLEPTDETVTVDDRFKYYILYKPKTTGAIWVPVARATWFWKAKAVRDGKEWKLVEKDGKVSAKGKITTEFPQYQSNVNENKWIEI